jgi:survival of motor neuron-related-splicing factor 30
MDKESLETYQVQLSQVELALVADPDNAELASLRSELQELIKLTSTLISQSESTASSSKSTDTSRKITAAQNSVTWSAGDECLAKYSGDGAWYPARINSVAGSAENRVYSIVFKSYNTTEQLEASSLKSLPSNHNLLPSTKRKAKEEEDEEKERKRKKNEKKLETRAAKAKEQVQKQASWQKFAKKSEKKGVHIAGMAGTSIFKTPDNPLGRGSLLRPSPYGTVKLIRILSGGYRKWQRNDGIPSKRKTQVRSSLRAGVITLS